MTRKLGLLLTTIIFLLQGCASIVSKTTYPVTVNSNPPGCNFCVKDEDEVIVHAGVTPQTVMLRSANGFFDGETYKITFSKPGYVESVAELDSYLDAWYLGNVIFGGLIGVLIVDPATGAMFALPSRVNENLAMEAKEAADPEEKVVGEQLQTDLSPQAPEENDNPEKQGS